MLDANALDTGGDGHQALVQRFQALAATGHLRVLLGSRIRDEIAHPQTPDGVRSAVMGFDTCTPRPLTHEEKLDRIRVRAVLRGDTVSDKHDADATHVSEAAEAGCAWFITQDKRILRRRDELRRMVHELRIASLAVFLDEI